jgi:putative peptide zinc metalloprotease protein
MSLVIPTFSESWHRVAGVKAALRPTVASQRQKFRGDYWYVLHDSFNNQFFRLRPAAYDFIARLSADRTIEEVWLESLERDPENAPGQEEAIRLLTQLHYANLLFYDTPSDSEQFFERYQKRKQRELQSKLMSIMFIRLPLFDPDAYLKKLLPYTKLLFSWVGAVIWFGVVLLALKVVIDNSDQVFAQAEGVLAPENMLLLYLGMVFIKSLHELGHTLICRHYGGEVHTLGVMLLIFTPLPYMDATSSWSFRSRWQRAFVGGAGMITEIFVAALAVFVWAGTGAGVVHSLAYNMMFVASVSTIIFNANPLLKFDGYYILSDLADFPNLYTRSRKHWVYWFEKYLFGLKNGIEVADSKAEVYWLSIYGALSGAYRIVVFAGIILFVADQYLILGLIMVAILVVTWVVVPPYKLTKYLASSPKLERSRGKAVSTVLALICVVVLLTAIVPLPNRFRAPGIAESQEYSFLSSQSSGVLEEVLIPGGTHVAAGDALLRLSDWELQNDIEMLNAQMQQLIATEQWALSQRSSDVQPLRQRRLALAQQLENLQFRQRGLIVRANQSGMWAAPDLEDQIGSWLQRGTQVGLLYNPDHFEFNAVVPQSEAANLFLDEIKLAEVRLSGRASKNFEVTNLKIIPFQSDQLPSAALSWLAGGDVITRSEDETGLRSTEPFFLIKADFTDEQSQSLYYGQSGKLRLTLEPEPLLWQVYRALRQLIQQRYQL